jgi:DNA helicase HerA-like ATPase
VSAASAGGQEVGRVLGTDPSHALEFWAAVRDDSYLQLDDIVAVESEVPGRGNITHYGVVDMVRARYEGAKFDSDVFRVSDGVLPVGISNAAHVSVTRIEPEVFVPPAPGRAVSRATESQRETALYFDQMKNRFPVGLSRDSAVMWGNLDFLNGTRGAHVNISGISGVATKTSCALFLLYSLFHHTETKEQLGPNARALVFNVKGEDLLHLDRPNAVLEGDDKEEERSKYKRLGLPLGPFQDVALWAPVGPDPFVPAHTLSSRQDNKVKSYFWSIRRFCEEGLLPFLFADADRETSQLQFVVSLVTSYLQRALRENKSPQEKGWVELSGTRITSFSDLVDYIQQNEDEIFPASSRVATGTIHAFIRRLQATKQWAGHLIRKSDSAAEEEEHLLRWNERQLNVIQIANLHDVAMRFVVGVTLKRLMLEKVAQGGREPLVFVVLDELNKYAPREGWSPIKEVVLDIAERGRSLGVILIGAQQTASEVERRVVANCSFRIVGRLDTAEAERSEYGFLTQAARTRASILKPGSMFMHQPEIPVPLLLQFPFPAWATRPDEVAREGRDAKWK